MTAIQKMIRGCDGAANNWFGLDLAVRGDWAAIGANGVSTYTGAVYLYKNDGNHWVFMQSLIASDGAEYDYFGIAVAISGSGHLVVNALYNNDKGSESGAVYLYTLNSTSNTWGDEQKIVAGDGAAYDFYDYFGSAVAMSDTGHLVVGAPGYDEDGNSGAVYLFTLNSTSNTWGNEQKVVASDGAVYKRFGAAVAMSGTGHLVVGALQDGGYSGAVYLYTLNSTSNTWGNEQKIVASDGAVVGGAAVAMSEAGHLVVGVPWDDEKGYNSGAVYLYTLNSTSNTWGDEQKIVASDGAADDLFGYAVAMSETGHLLVGAPYDDDKGEGSGAVYAIGEGVSLSLFCYSWKIWM
jgi:hypothetical protein